MGYKISLSRLEITKKDKEAVLGVLNTPYLALGPKLQEFEEKLANYVGRKYAVALNSGTSALHLIIRSLGIGKGSVSASTFAKASADKKATADKDEVITTPFSFIASANCMLFEGAKPVFADIKSDTLNIDPELVEGLITKRTKAILAVDVFGHPAEWDKLESIAKKYKLKLIEDSAESLGSRYKNRMCGSFGDAAIFSFYPNKQATMGEGGALVTDSDKIFELSRSMRNQGRDERVKARGLKKGEYKSWLQHIRLGYNYRISDINCALGIAQLERIGEIIAKREKVANMYNERLNKIPELEIPYVASNIKMSWFVYVIRLKDKYSAKDRDLIIRKLGRRGIQASNYFPCIHLQPFYRKLFDYKKGNFPTAESISARTIALPFYNNLKKKEIDFVAKSLKEILK